MNWRDRSIEFIKFQHLFAFGELPSCSLFWFIFQPSNSNIQLIIELWAWTFQIYILLYWNASTHTHTHINTVNNWNSWFVMGAEKNRYSFHISSTHFFSLVIRFMCNFFIHIRFVSNQMSVCFNFLPLHPQECRQNVQCRNNKFVQIVSKCELPYCLFSLSLLCYFHLTERKNKNYRGAWIVSFDIL